MDTKNSGVGRGRGRGRGRDPSTPLSPASAVSPQNKDVSASTGKIHVMLINS